MFILEGFSKNPVHLTFSWDLNIEDLLSRKHCFKSQAKECFICLRPERSDWNIASGNKEDSALNGTFWPEFMSSGKVAKNQNYAPRMNTKLQPKLEQRIIFLQNENIARLPWTNMIKLFYWNIVFIQPWFCSFRSSEKFLLLCLKRSRSHGAGRGVIILPTFPHTKMVKCSWLGLLTRTFKLSLYNWSSQETLLILRPTYWLWIWIWKP